MFTVPRTSFSIVTSHSVAFNLASVLLCPIMRQKLRTSEHSEWESPLPLWVSSYRVACQFVGTALYFEHQLFLTSLRRYFRADIEQEGLSHAHAYHMVPAIRRRAKTRKPRDLIDLTCSRFTFLEWQWATVFSRVMMERYVRKRSNVDLRTLLRILILLMRRWRV